MYNCLIVSWESLQKLQVDVADEIDIFFEFVMQLSKYIKSFLKFQKIIAVNFVILSYGLAKRWLCTIL